MVKDSAKMMIYMMRQFTLKSSIKNQIKNKLNEQNIVEMLIKREKLFTNNKNLNSR